MPTMIRVVEELVEQMSDVPNEKAQALRPGLLWID
jgi:hypothetical protein